MIDSLLACGLVLGGFALARALSARLGHPPWASPVLITALGVAGVLALLGIAPDRFAAAALPIRWLLGPALVALALVIDANRGLLRAQALPVLAAILGGAIVGVTTAIAGARLLGLDPLLVEALATKTVTTPFTVAIMKATGGPLPLAAALSVLTGVIGALTVPWLFDRLGWRDHAARSLALGVSSHIVGTDWLTRRDAKAGGLAALAFVLTGTVVALVLVPLWPFLFG